MSRRTRGRRVKKKLKGAPARARRPSARVADDFEDRLLAADARRALADPERIPYEQVRKDLKLD
jgi:hypothetical protein